MSDDPRYKELDFYSGEGRIDTRDLAARLDELEDVVSDYVIEAVEDDDSEEADLSARSEWAEQNPDEAAELVILREIREQVEGYSGDSFDGGVSLIADWDFEDYARDLADDIGAIDGNAGWPTSHIDWEAAANALKLDYTTVEINGTDYWFRA